MLTNLSERRPATIEDNIYAAGPIKKLLQYIFLID